MISLFLFFVVCVLTMREVVNKKKRSNLKKSIAIIENDKRILIQIIYRGGLVDVEDFSHFAGRDNRSYTILRQVYTVNSQREAKLRIQEKYQ